MTTHDLIESSFPPDDPDALLRLADMKQSLGQLEEAVSLYRQALAMQPEHIPACHELANALQRLGLLDEASDYYERVLALQPERVEAHCNLGSLELRRGRPHTALAHLQQAQSLRPDMPEIALNLGNVLLRTGHVDDAIACYRQTLHLNAKDPDVHHNLASAAKAAGRLDEALACYERALLIDPGHALAHSGRLYTLHFHPRYDAGAILEEHRRWDEQNARSLAQDVPPHDNDPTPDRRLRIGYMSPDLCDHVVARFLLPLLVHHDRAEIEVICFADVACPDEVTKQLRACSDTWVGTCGLSDAELAMVVRKYRVDILVDLTMHMAGSRLLAFARRPAPVQVTYMAYPGTTGLSAMDYRLTDPYLDPPGTTDTVYVEHSVRLPETFWCWEPPLSTPPVGALPALKTGYVNFGCLNNFCKITRMTIETWAGVLRGVAGSKLILLALEGQHRQDFRDQLAAQGVEPERLEFVSFLPRAEYFAKYHQIDIALDPFPYVGATTTCDALWMGVPVVTFVGQTAVARAGLSMLSNVGLQEFIARSTEEYIELAIAWAADLKRLSTLRSALRERMSGSPLMDGARFAHGVEAAYRMMWRRWCDSRSPPT